MEQQFTDFIVVPLSSHEIDGVRKEQTVRANDFPDFQDFQDGPPRIYDFILWLLQVDLFLLQVESQR